MKFLNSFKVIFYFSFFLLSNSVFSSENLDNKIRELTLELRCMTCQNQSVYDSDSEFAEDIKIIVKEKFNEGLDKKEIKILSDYFDRVFNLSETLFKCIIKIYKKDPSLSKVVFSRLKT